MKDHEDRIIHEQLVMHEEELLEEMESESDTAPCYICGFAALQHGLCRSCLKVDEDEWKRQDEDERGRDYEDERGRIG